jgi:hypothetical protein
MFEEEPKKRGRKPKKQPYFGPKEEEAVIKYLSLGNIIEDRKAEFGFRWTGTTKELIERNRIYSNTLKHPLEKMVESIIRRYKLYSKDLEYEDLHSDVLSFLHIKLNNFKPDKNKKSYSYFGTICKNYLLGKVIKENKDLKKQIDYDDMSEILESDESLSYTIDDEYDKTLEIIDKISEEIKKEISQKILTENELKVGNALVNILDNWQTLMLDVSGRNKFNKNLILYYMREMTLLNTKDIRNSMKRYKNIYKILKETEF